MSKSVFNVAGEITGTAATNIPKFSRVVGPVGPDRTFTLAGLTDRADAITTEEGFEGELVRAKLLSGADTNFGVSAAAITAGAPVSGAAGGELSATQGEGAFVEGYAITAAGAAGDAFEWRYKPELTAGTA